MTQFEKLIKQTGLQHQKFLQELDLTYVTWQARRTNPLALNLKELVIIARLIRIEPDALLNIILAENPVDIN